MLTPPERSVFMTEDHDKINHENDLFHHHRRLVQWVTHENDGYLHPDVRIAHSSEKGFHMVVANGQTIPALTRVTSSPMTATLSVLNALDIAPFRSHGSKFPATFLRKNAKKPELLQTFFLMQQYVRGEKSWWASYIKTLPSMKDINDLQFDSREDQLWLDGTNLKSASISQTTKWQEMYTKGLRELKILNWQPALDGRFTWELFRWAATIFGSRSFTSEVLTDTEPADQARMEGRNGVEKSEHDFLKPLFVERFAVLLPLLDILNHKPIAQVEWQARCSFVGMQVLSAFSSGDELCNNYGPRDNEGLLLSYGFTITDNPFDHVAIALRAPPPSCPLATARKEWQQDLRSTPEYRSYIFDISHPRAEPGTASCFESAVFSYDLLDTLSILKGNDRELQTMYMNRQTLMSFSLAKPHKFEDFRNFLGVLSQLYLDCKARAERLRSTYPLGSPHNTKQSHAKVYRDRQLSIIETATAVCELILVRACSERTKEWIAADQERRISWPAFDNMKRLSKQHALITRQNELLTVENILDFLSGANRTAFKKAMDEVEEQVSSNHSQKVETAPRTSPPSSPSKRKRSPNQPQREANPLKKSSSDDTNSKRAKDTTPVQTAAPSIPQGPLSLNLTKSRLSLLLAFSLHLFLVGHILPLRLRSWLEQLTSWYPPEDPNWSYVPHDGPWEVGEEPPMGLVELLKARHLLLESWQRHSDGASTLMDDGESTARGQKKNSGDDRERNRVKQWLTPERLCWGWNVVEEEGVVVSKDILRFAEDKTKCNEEDFLLQGSELELDRRSAEGVEFLLYCKQ